MSLILEALKKVERERTAPEQRGFLVLGPAAWAPARSNAGWIVGVIAAAALAGGAVYMLTRPDAVPAPPVLAVAPPATEAMTPDSGSGAAAWQPPPMVPRARANAPAAVPRTPVASAPALVLHAISEQDGVPVAVINDQVVREGQSVGGVRVVRIGASEVEIEAGGVRRTLRF